MQKRRLSLWYVVSTLESVMMLIYDNTFSFVRIFGFSLYFQSAHAWQSVDYYDYRAASDGTNTGSQSYVIARLSGSPEVLLILLKMSAVIKLLCLC